MKTYQNILAAAALVLGFASCSEDALVQGPQTEQPSVEVTIGANFATTRTTMDADGSVLWSEGDQIKVQVGENAYDFDLASGKGTTSATFRAIVTPADAAILAGTAEGTVTAYYPTSGAAVPATQTYAEGTFADGMNPMTATYANSTLTFTNNAAVVRVQGVSATATNAVLSYTVGETPYSVTMALTAGETAKDLYFVVVPGAQDFNLALDGAEAVLYKASAVTEAGSRYNITAPAAKIGTTYYNSLKEAFDAVQDGETIDVLTNAVLSNTLNVTKSFTLNLGINTLTAACSGYLFNLNTTEAGKTFTIKGTDKDNCGHIISNGTSGHNGVAVINGQPVTFAMNAVKVHGATESDYYNAGSVIISDNSEDRNDLIKLTDVSIKGNQDLVSGSAGRAYASIDVKGGVYSTTQRGFRFCGAASSSSVVDGADISTAGGIAVYAFSIATLKNSTISMTSSSNNDAVACSRKYNTDAVLTIEDTNITVTKGSGSKLPVSAIASEDKGVVIVKSGTFENKNASTYVVKVSTSGGVINFQGGTVLAQDGQTTMFANTQSGQDDSQNPSKVNITGGVIYGNCGVSSDHARVEINGGTFKDAITLHVQSSQHVSIMPGSTAVFEGKVTSTQTTAVTIPAGTFKKAIAEGDLKSGSTISGGTFYEATPYADYIANGYIAQAQGTDPETWKVVETPATEVATEQALRTAISTGGKIKLTSDITLTSAIRMEKDVTIDLNGKTLSTGSMNGVAVNDNRAIDARANVTIKNGTVNGPSINYGYGLMMAYEGGSLTLENVTATTTGICVISRASSGPVTIKSGTYTSTSSTEKEWNDHGSGCAVDAQGGGVVNIEGGTFTGAYYAAAIFTSGGTLNISGGTFNTGTYNAMSKDGTATYACSLVNDGDNTKTGNLNISGGTINGNVRGRVSDASGHPTNLTITGGTFDKECKLLNFDSNRINLTGYSKTEASTMPSYGGKIWTLTKSN